MVFRSISLFLIYAIIIIPTLIFAPSLNQSFELIKTSSFRILTSLLLISTGLTIYFEQKKINIQIIKTHKYLWIFFLGTISIFIISTIFSISPFISFWGSYARHQGLYTFIHYVILMSCILLIYPNQKEKLTIIWIIISSATIVSIYAILQKLQLDFLISTSIKSEFLGRVFSTLGHPNFLGQYLILIIPVSIGLILNQKNIRIKLILKIALLFQFSALFFSGSRSCLGVIFISLLFFGSIYLYLKKNKKHWRIWWTSISTIIGLSCLGIIIIYYKIWPELNSFLNISQQTEYLRSIHTRLLLYPQILKMIIISPFMGYGLESFGILSSQLKSPTLLSLEHFSAIADRAHNEPLDLAFQIGIPGMILYFSAFIILIKKSLHYVFHKTHHKWIVLGITCGLINSIIINQLNFPVTIHYIHITLLISWILLTITTISPQYKPIKNRYFGLFMISIIIFINLFINIQIIRADYFFNLTQQAANIEENINQQKKIIAINPIYNEYTLVLAQLYIANPSSKNIEQGLKIIKTAEQRNYYDTYIHWMKAKLFYIQGDLQKSKLEYEIAFKLAPFNPIIIQDWGENLYQQNKFKRSIEKLEYLLKISPPYWKWLIVDVSNKSKYQQKQFRIFFKHNSHFLEIFPILSNAYQKIGNFNKANYYKQFIITN